MPAATTPLVADPPPLATAASTPPRHARFRRCYNTLQAGNFTSAFVLAPVTGGGMYIKAEALRFGPGETPFNTAADSSGAALEFAKSYYATYAAGKAG